MFFKYLFSMCVIVGNSSVLENTELTSNMESGSNNALPLTGLVRIRRVSSRYKRMFVVALVLMIVLCVAIVAGVLLSSSSQKEISESPVSLPLTSYISLENCINQSVDPCEDFYSFACGHWENASRVVNSKAPFIGSFAILQEEIDNKLRDLFMQTSVSADFPKVLNNAILYYKTCIGAEQDNFTYSQSLKDVFESIGGWPLILGDKWNDADFDWPLASVHLMKTLGIQSGFGIGVMIDFEDSSRNLLVVKPPTFNHELFEYLSLIFYCMVSNMNSSLTEEQLASAKMQIITIELEMFKITQTQNRFKTTKMSISDLQREIEAVNWLPILQAFTNDTLCPSRCLTENDIIIVNDIETLKRVITFIDNQNHTKRDVANFFGWLIVVDLYEIIPGVMKQYGRYFGYEKEELHTVVKNICYDSVKTFKFALDYLFIKNFSYFDIKDNEKLVHYSKKAFRKLIMASDWLDDETKGGILMKLNYMSDVVGYPKFYSSKEQLDKICTKFPVMGNDTIRNYVETLKFFMDIELYQLKLSNTRENYVLPRPVTHVSAYYDLHRNTIVFPLSIQNPPFFYFNGPWYLNFGAIGAVIGHEINHGFDKRGHMFDKTGSLVNWWTNTSIEKFNDHLSCFEEQYYQYKYKYRGTLMSINGTCSLSENMADSSGLRQAYLAYKLWKSEIGKDRVYSGLEQYSSDQMFFLSFASLWCSKPNPNSFTSLNSNPHSPPRIRVIGSVSNSEDFARAFNCPVGSPMNPKKKCTLW